MPMKKILLLTLLSVSFLSQGQNKKLDSLYASLKQYNKEDSIKVKLIFSICRVEIFLNRDAIPKLANEALKISQKINFTNGIGFSYTYLVLYHRANGEYDQVADYALKMVDVFEHSTNADGLGQAYNMLGVANFETKNFDRAQYYQEKSLEVHGRSGQRYDMSRNYMNLGMIFSETLRHDEAIASFEKSLAISEEFKNEEGIFNAYVNLAQAYLKRETQGFKSTLLHHFMPGFLLS